MIIVIRTVHEMSLKLAKLVGSMKANMNVVVEVMKLMFVIN